MELADILLDYSFIVVAIGSILIGLVSGALGVFAILRKQSLLGDVVSHTSFFGIVVVFLLLGITGANARDLFALLLGAIVAGTISMLVVNHLHKHSRIKKDTGMGIVLAVFFGLGVALLRVVQGLNIQGSSGLDSFIFGNAASMTVEDLRVIIFFTIIAAIFLFSLWKEFKIYTFDPEYAHTNGFIAKYLEPLLVAILVIAVVVGLQTVGVILMVSLIVAPGLAARQWTNHLGVTVGLAGIFGALSGLLGAVVSVLNEDLPTGPVIVLVLVAFVFVSLLFAPKRGVIAIMLLRYRQRKELKKEQANVSS
jgi:manganese/zinc/iron transport system permease protein